MLHSVADMAENSCHADSESPSELVELGTANPSSTQDVSVVAHEPGKRKLVETESSFSTSHTPTKKLKLTDKDGAQSSPSRQSHWSLLPAPVWHRVFTFVSPKTLGILLRSSKMFHAYLDPSSPFKSEQQSLTGPTQLQSLTPDNIWRMSRTRFFPSMPPPLTDRTELDMWRLLCRAKCQFCGKENAISTDPTNHPWEVGPGHNGVKVVWEFALISCGPCLMDKTTKVIHAP
jgi:hypothetical protein